MIRIFIFFIAFFLSSCSYKIMDKKEIDSKLNRTSKIETNNTLSRKFSVELMNLEMILNNIIINTYGIKNSQNNNIKIKLTDGNNALIAFSDNTIGVNTTFLKAIRENVFTKNEIKAAVCHEFSHILNDDWGYKMIKDYNLNTLNFTVDTFFHLFYVNSENEKVSNIGENKDIIELIDFSDQRLQKNYLFPLNVELNADILAVSCLERLGVKQAPQAIINLLRTLNLNFHPNKVKTNKRIEALMELM